MTTLRLLLSFPPAAFTVVCV